MDIKASLKKIDFADLEISEIGAWPIILRLAVLAAVCALSLSLGYFFIIKNSLNQLVEQKKQNETKRIEFKDKYNIAANLDVYEKQMMEIKESYKNMVKELPFNDQLPDLIENLSREAEHNNLKYQSIKPGEARSMQGFYKELPLDLILTGTYNGFGGFVSDVTKIPRIVTLHDFDIKQSPSAKDVKNSGELTMNIQLKTYWLSSEPDIKQTTPNKGSKIPKEVKESKTPQASKKAKAPKDTNNESNQGGGVKDGINNDKGAAIETPGLESKAKPGTP